MHIVFAIAGIVSILGILLDAFETVVLNGAAPGAPSSLETNVMVAEILDAARRSAASGKSVRLAGD